MTRSDLLLPQEAPDAARRLLGCELIRELDGKQVRVRIVETEAYDQTDAASHSYKGRTPRTDIMFGPSGHLYVYFAYGLHYCCNVVVGADGTGAAVLLRAAEPLDGTALIEARRGTAGRNATNGPAKLCQALAIGTPLNGHDLRCPPLRLIMQPPLTDSDIMQTVRIGISKAADTPWRFLIRGNPYVSHGPR